MLLPDRGTRNLLPILIDRQDGIVRAPDDDGATVRPVPSPDLPASHSSHPAIDPALPRIEPIHQDAAYMPQTSAAPAAQSSAAHAASPTIDPESPGAIGGGSGESIEIDAHEPGGFSAHGFSSSAFHAGAPVALQASDEDIGESDEEQPDHVTEGKHPDSLASEPASLPETPAAAAPAQAASAAIPIAVPDGDDIHIVQTAFVDQDADVLLNGWMGESKIRVFMDNDADMVQNADIALDIDDNDRLFLRLDQSMTIDQDTEIDLDIYEVEGVLYVDLYLKNQVDIVQDTELDLMMDGWDGPSRIVVNNDLDIRQDVDIDVDIEDELEEKFAIKVAIGVKQAIDADQDADIDINYADGGFGVDVDAIQTATIDQDTTLRIDFSLV